MQLTIYQQYNNINQISRFKFLTKNDIILLPVKKFHKVDCIYKCKRSFTAQGGINMDDIVILALLRENPPEGLRNIIAKYRGLVGKISSGLLAGQQEDMEEVIADTFISIWKHADKIDLQKGSLKSLVIITARNHAINRWRKLKNNNLVILENPDTLLDESFDALNALISEENAQEIQEFINNLPQPHREIFVRRHYLLEPIKDIAENFNMDVKQISNYLYQSKLRLREIAIKEEITNE